MRPFYLLCLTILLTFTLSACQGGDRKRVQSFSPRFYHDYVKHLGDDYQVPDLAIAFNSGASEEESQPWHETIKLLVEKKVPTAFTVSVGQVTLRVLTDCRPIGVQQERGAEGG